MDAFPETPRRRAGAPIERGGHIGQPRPIERIGTIENERSASRADRDR
jgi:hypothetical protein